VSVTTHSLDLLGVDVDLVRLRVECSAGFYVRSLAHDLGAALGTGAHLAGLRRTRCGSETIDAAVPLGELEQQPGLALRRLVPLAAMLTDLPAVVLSAEGVRHAAQGRTLIAGDFAEGPATIPDEALAGRRASVPVRLLTPAGELLAVATWQAPESSTSPTPVLHPSVVLG
jgi:tRNA pseudouridine55 synthase